MDRIGGIGYYGDGDGDGNGDGDGHGGGAGREGRGGVLLS